MIIRDAAQDVKEWAAQQWGAARLSDQRRTARAVIVGAQLAAQPAAGLPAQTGSWKDLKAAYRLFNEPDVTHAALTHPHRQATLSEARAGGGVVLFVQDGTELDFTRHRQVAGLGRLSTDKRHGLLVHTCLAWSAASGELGLAAQQVWRRAAKPATRPTSKRASSRRDTEYDVWAAVLRELGPAPAPASGTTWVSVGDRASDIYGYFRQAAALGWEVVARAARDRIMEAAGGERARLMRWARRLPGRATKEVSLRARPGVPARTARLRLAWAPCRVPAPRDGKERGGPRLGVSVVRAWEAEAPAGVAPLEWVLVTTLAVGDAQSAVRVTEYYERRWLIEEYHKCLKTGCAIEARQLETADGLEALLGFLSVIAVRLLRLREASRHQPDALARHSIAPELLTAARSYLELPARELTLREFWRAVARLGGFLGRQRDGDPGWQTIWRGWQKLQDLAWQPSP